LNCDGGDDGGEGAKTRSSETRDKTLIVLGLLKLLFRDEGTANLIYTNDRNVIIDIILREVGDLPPGADDRRAAFISVLHGLLLNSDWYNKGAYKRKMLHKLCKSVAGVSDGAENALSRVAMSDLLNDCEAFIAEEE
jgi:hypothetical protein